MRVEWAARNRDFQNRGPEGAEAIRQNLLTAPFFLRTRAEAIAS